MHLPTHHAYYGYLDMCENNMLTEIFTYNQCLNTRTNRYSVGLAFFGTHHL